MRNWSLSAAAAVIVSAVGYPAEAGAQPAVPFGTPVYGYPAYSGWSIPPYVQPYAQPYLGSSYGGPGVTLSTRRFSLSFSSSPTYGEPSYSYPSYNYPSPAYRYYSGYQPSYGGWGGGWDRNRGWSSGWDQRGRWRARHHDDDDDDDD